MRWTVLAQLEAAGYVESVDTDAAADAWCDTTIQGNALAMAGSGDRSAGRPPAGWFRNCWSGCLSMRSGSLAVTSSPDRPAGRRRHLAHVRQKDHRLSSWRTTPTPASGPSIPMCTGCCGGTRRWCNTRITGQRSSTSQLRTSPGSPTGPRPSTASTQTL